MSSMSFSCVDGNNVYISRCILRLIADIFQLSYPSHYLRGEELVDPFLFEDVILLEEFLVEPWWMEYSGDRVLDVLQSGRDRYDLLDCRPKSLDVVGPIENRTNVQIVVAIALEPFSEEMTSHRGLGLKPE